jgi:hypothetical protein
MFRVRQDTVTKSWGVFECDTTTQDAQNEFAWDALTRRPGALHR